MKNKINIATNAVTEDLILNFLKTISMHTFYFLFCDTLEVLKFSSISSFLRTLSPLYPELVLS